MKILESNNYGRFVLSRFNRDVKRTRWLEESMRKYGWLNAYPAHVRRLENGKFEIVAGHHRYEVAMKLGIPIKYVEEKAAAEMPTIHELEKATNPWTMKDWLQSHMRTGKENYAALMDYHQRTGIGISMCISMLGGHGSGGAHLNQSFKDGTFKMGDLSHANIVGDIIIFCKAYGVPFARDQQFVAAVSKISYAEGFDAQVLKNKIVAHMELLTKQATMKMYVDMLDLVFNRASRVKVPLAFNADEAARQRAMAQSVPYRFTGNSKARPNMQVVPNRRKRS